MHMVSLKGDLPMVAHETPGMLSLFCVLLFSLLVIQKKNVKNRHERAYKKMEKPSAV